jgi:serine/threonine protein kinase
MSAFLALAGKTATIRASMKLSREGKEGGSSEADEGGGREADQSLTDVGDEPYLTAAVLEIERGAVLAGRYQIETTIGKGGSGVVLRAFDRIAQSPVAVKILKPELAADPRWVERFSRELRLGRQIQHGNVCRVFDLGEADGHRFLTMELASEGTLRTGARTEAPPRAIGKRIADARALASGMAAIHAAGIVHRDIKPENLLRMEDGRLVVSDFGLATNPTQTAAVTLMVGTPSYMAPEMAMGDPASFRSDVWAIGVVMHEILFARRPEWEVTPRERLFRSPLDKDASPTLRALARLCADCAAENPAVRPADAGEVARRFMRAEDAAASARTDRSLLHRRWGWAALALTTTLALWGARKRWWPHAGVGSSSYSDTEKPLVLGGTALDVSAARRVAAFDGRVHCVSLLPGGHSVRVIVGDPQQAWDVDVDTGARVAAPLRPETYAFGCPAVSSDGRDLLYETIDQTGGHEISHSRSPDGEGGRVITKGRFPIWIPGSQDFVFDLDLTHAAVFSIPVMNSSLVSDDLNGQRRLVEKAVSFRGDYLALRYLDDRGENLLAVHALPTLELQTTLSLNSSARNLHFDRRTDQAEVSVDGTQGNSLLALVDWRAGMARYHASLPAWDLRDSMTDERGDVLFVSRKLFNDLWEDPTPGAPPRRLTTDGTNDNAAISPSTGRLLVQKRRSNGEYVVMLFERGASSPRLTTGGPLDVMPSFSEANGDWFFVRDRQRIVRCDKQLSCAELHVDQQLPAWPIASPNGENVAYLTWLKTPRLKVLALKTGSVRDLGAALTDCAPAWSDKDHVWTVQASERGRDWIEIDVRTGDRTGRQRPAGSDGQADSPSCWLDEATSPNPYPRVRVVGRESSEIRAMQSPEWQ